MVAGVPIEDYSRIQTEVVAMMNRVRPMGWDGRRDPAGQYFSGGGFRESLPLILATCCGPDALGEFSQHFDSRPETERLWMSATAPGWQILPVDLCVEVYDLGMATMQLVLEIRVPVEAEWQHIPRTMKRLVWLRPDEPGQVTQISEALRAVARQVTHEWHRTMQTVGAGYVQRSWRHDDHTQPDHAGSDVGRLLWLHPVFSVECDSPDDLGAVDQLAAPFHAVMTVPDGRFATGIGWSAVSTMPSDMSNRAPLRLTLLHWAYIALYMEIDRGLVAILDRELANFDDAARTGRDADRAFDDYIRVMQARARVDTALASLGGDEQAIWDTIAGVSRFQALEDGVDRKVEVIQRLAERRVQQASAAQSRNERHPEFPDRADNRHGHHRDHRRPAGQPV